MMSAVNSSGSLQVAQIIKSEPAPRRRSEVAGPVRGYGGWLAFFCFVHIYVAPVLAAVGAIFTLIALGQIADRMPGLATAVVLETAAGIVLTIWGYRAAQDLRALRAGAVGGVKNLLWAQLAWSFFALLLPVMTELPAETFAGAVKGLVRTLIGFAIWYSYFSASKRIQATFQG